MFGLYFSFGSSISCLNYINLQNMKRKPSHQFFHHQTNSKPTVKKIKSPNIKRFTYKKQQEASSLMLAKHKVNHSREEGKADSNNTTVSAKPKSHKSIKITRQKADKYQQIDIMSLINRFATKIQRQWRTYRFRKRINTRINQRRSIQTNNDKSSKEIKIQLDQRKIKKMARFEQQQYQSEENYYDRLKYKQLSPAKLKKKSTKYIANALLSNSSKETSKISAKSQSITPRNQVQQQKKCSQINKQSKKIIKVISKSLQKAQSSQNILQYAKQKQQRRASFNSIEIQKITENRRHSTGDLNNLVQRNNLKIDKAYDLRIQQQERPRPSQKSLHSSRKIQKIDNEGAIAFGKVPFLEQIKSRYKKELQLSKFKQLISVQNRYKKNEVTYRSYLDLVGKIKQEHSFKLKQIKQKEVQLKNTWNQLLQLYKTNPQQAKFAEDENQQNNTSHLDVSVSFERWDFNSSAKKSIDAFDFPQTAGSKVLSIESVLKELEQEDNQEVSLKTHQQQKLFKKNKSLKVIQTIDQRSKEISQRDAQGQTPQKKSMQKQPIVVVFQSSQKLKTEKSENDQQKINFFEEQDQGSKELDIKEEWKQAKEKQISIELQSQSNAKIQQKESNMQNTPFTKKNQQSSASQSLLITPGSTSNKNILASEQHIQLENEKIQVIDEQKEQNGQTFSNLDELEFRQVFSPTYQIQKMHPFVIKFRELVIERIVMTNIKTINSIKFVCARAAEEKKRQKTVKAYLHPIETDINSVNTWLLQISHFVLDNYQQLIRDNLVQVKQPAAIQVLAMARKGYDTIPIYQTIPEFSFKDFEFYYIKTLARNNGITAENYDKFSSLNYTFHRVLVDSLNTALMQELTTGREWVKTPWRVPLKFKANRVVLEQAKLSLQRSINVVSNWGQYGLGRLYKDEQVSEAQHKQYQQQKINLVCREQVLQMNLCYFFSIGNVLLQLASKIIQQQFLLAINQFLALPS